jgi:hypothetical protein
MRTLRPSCMLVILTITLANMLVGSPVGAHESRGIGDLEMVVGFGTEPAYTGQPNSVQLLLVHHGEPVTDLGDSLEVEVSFGDQSETLPLEPFFEVGEFGTPGDYRAWFVPSQPGEYSFHFTGRVDGERVDESFTSGPRTFSDVQDIGGAAFPPTNAPSNEELAQRLTADAERVRTELRGVRVDAEDARDAASSARTLAAVGLALGVVGLVFGIRNQVALRRRQR